MPLPIDPFSGDRAPDSTNRPSGETLEKILQGEMGGRVPAREPEQHAPEGSARRRFHIPPRPDVRVEILFLADARHGRLLPHKDHACENPNAPKPRALIVFITAAVRRGRQGGWGSAQGCEGSNSSGRLVNMFLNQTIEDRAVNPELPSS